MKTLKRLPTIILLILLTHQISAQSFIVRGGLNLSSFSQKYDGQSYDDNYKMNPGFHLGAYTELPFSKMLTLETGLGLNTKGHRIEEDNSFDPFFGSTSDYKSKVNLLYLDIPLVAKASFNIGKTKLYGSFGPYVGFGLSGKTRFIRTPSNESDRNNNEVILEPIPRNIDITERVRWGTTEDLPLIQPEEYRLRRLDYGVIFGAGIEFKSIQLGCSYGLGLADISPNKNDRSKRKNKVLSLSIGYRLFSKQSI